MTYRALAGIAVLLVASGTACRSTEKTHLALTVRADADLELDHVAITVSGGGRPDQSRTFDVQSASGTPPAVPEIKWQISIANVTSPFVAIVQVRGIKGQEDLVTLTAEAAISPNSRVETILTLSNVCKGVVCAGNDRTCIDGSCQPHPIFGAKGDAGAGADSAPGNDVADAAIDAFLVDRAPDGVATGADPSLDGGFADTALPKMLGVACQTDAECGSSHCVEGLCCNESCVGSCQTCDSTAMPGYCVAVTAGQAAPAKRAPCVRDNVATCKQTGLCDGRGSCQLYADGEVCQAASCNATTNTIASSRCDGMGACKTELPLSCAPFRCKAGDAQCARTCTANADCDGQPCLASSCGKLKTGATCAADTECELGFCVDAVCCNLRCAGQCQACNLSGSVGMCSSVKSGPPVGGRVACSGTGTCGGSCNGQAECSYPATTASCRVASCDVATLTAPASCNGAGACPALSTSVCPNHLRCQAGTAVCLTQCATAADCLPAFYCSGTTCAATKVNGTPCVMGIECASGQCADGVCCNRACEGSCEACSGAGVATPGTCTFTTGAARHAPLCMGTGTCAGTCKGQIAACVFPGAELSCRPASCSADSTTATTAAACDGLGNCPALSTRMCAPFTCQGTNCLTSCTINSQCAAGLACIGNSCAACPAGQSICPGVNGCVNLGNDGSDGNNCGACGHTCLGGKCVGRICQPISLGSIPSGAVGNLIPVGNVLYVTTAPTMTPSNLWSLDANIASTPVSLATGLFSNPRCAINGKIFWVSGDGGTVAPSPISSCTLTNCVATTQIFTTTPGHIFSNDGPICDPATGELVWDDTTQLFGSNVITIYRSPTSGAASPRVMTSFLQGSDLQLEIGFVSRRPDRWFFTRASFVAPLFETLYYVATNVPNISPVSIATGGPGSNGLGAGVILWATDNLAIWPDDSGPLQVLSVPLPNGIANGSPAIFYPGFVSSNVMDSQMMYGAFSTLPTDAVGKCPLTNCTIPTVLFRGQQSANAFAQDSTAIYWTTPGLASIGFAVWKAAK